VSPRTALLASALVVAAVLGWLAWPRPAGPRVEQAGTDRHVVRLAAGADRWTVEVDDRTGAPAAVDEVVLEPVMVDMGHAAEPVTARADRPGRFALPAPPLPMDGQWQVTVRFRDPGGEERAVLPLLHDR
jgi:hypothetical protein